MKVGLLTWLLLANMFLGFYGLRGTGGTLAPHRSTDVKIMDGPWPPPPAPPPSGN
jgi:hypothetical protein